VVRLFLLALLCAPMTVSGAEIRSSLFSQQPPSCVRGKLDLSCTPGSGARWVEFQKSDPRFEHNAVTVRFGARTKESPSKLAVQFGKFANTALFIAALIVTFLL